jgi:FXSXX-COOH protein
MTWVPLIDVSGLTLDELVNSDNPQIAAATARVIASLDDPDGIISAFQSCVE